MSNVRIIVNSTIGDFEVDLDSRVGFNESTRERAFVHQQLTEAVIRIKAALAPLDGGNA